MQSMIRRVAIGIAISFSCLSAHAASKANDPVPGTRSGPFVVSERSLSELANDGYEIRGNMGTSLILQKGASIYSCQVPPDPEKLSFKPYFVCSELDEELPKGLSKPPKIPLPPHSHN